MSKIQETHTQNYPSKILDHNNEIATKKMLLHVEQMIFALEEFQVIKIFFRKINSDTKNITRIIALLKNLLEKKHL